MVPGSIPGGRIFPVDKRPLLTRRNGTAGKGVDQWEEGGRMGKRRVGGWRGGGGGQQVCQQLMVVLTVIVDTNG